MMRKLFGNWPMLVFILVPLTIITVASTVMMSEGLEPETVKATRLVKESRSRKENFTVQQYLYTTVYYRKEKGEAIEIHGWRAEQASGPGTAVTVTFSYSDSQGPHIATWQASLKTRKVIPQDQTASNVSWY